MKKLLLCLLMLSSFAASAKGQRLAEISQPALSQPAIDAQPLYVPDLQGVLPRATDPKSVSATIQILTLLTVLALVPSILVMTTAFPRIIIVFGLLRQAMGTPQLPPGQVLLGLSLFMTMAIMTPVWQKIHTEAVAPYLESEPGMTQERAMDIALGHMREFMYRQIVQSGNDEDIFLFLEYSLGRPIRLDEKVHIHAETPETIVVPTSALIPAFMLSELKTAFLMGFRIYLPFLVIDMVIATILISMGMMMLPPVMISLPFKLILFVLADGWRLVTASLMHSFIM